MVEFAGYWMPVQYEGIMGEHLWTRENAGLFDVSHMGQLVVSSEDEAQEDAITALEALMPADLSILKIGRQRYSLLLNETGGILDDLMITRWRNGFFLIVNGATKWDDIGHLREFLPDDITLTHRDDFALLAARPLRGGGSGLFWYRTGPAGGCRGGPALLHAGRTLCLERRRTAYQPQRLYRRGWL
jgi:aminomethyltransferase